MSVKSERDRWRRKLEPRENVKPCVTFSEAAPWLRRPFAPEAVRFKVVEAWADTGDGAHPLEPAGGRPTKDAPLSHATIAPYITAREVIARLNLVCPALWSEEYAPQHGKDGALMWCTLTMRERDWTGASGYPKTGLTITRRDVGSTYDGKGLVSDALKRAAVKFGVGESLYAVPRIEVHVGMGSEEGVFLRPWRIDGEPWLKLTRAGEEHCRDIYRRWLLARGGGIDSFGKPIDHGNLTMRGEVEGEGPPMPVLRPGEKRDTPAKRGRQAPQPIVTTASTGAWTTSNAPDPTTTDPEELAAVELAKVLAVTDGLGTLRDVLDKTMIAQGVERPSERLRTILDAGDKRGLDAALLRFARVEQATSDGPIEQEGDTT